MSEGRYKSLFVMALIVLSGGAAAFWASEITGKGNSGTYIDLNALQIKAKKEDLTKRALAIGLVRPKVGAEVKVGSQVSGIVKKVHVGVGDEVKRGQPLATLDNSMQKEEVKVIGEELKIKKYQYEYSKTQYQRIITIKDVSQESIDSARTTMNINKSYYEQTKAKLKSAKILLGYTSITAPINGTIASISTYEGETVAASFSAPTFVNIIDLDRQEVHAYVDETDIGNVFIGQPVTFNLESYPDIDFVGTVDAINPTASIANNVVTYIVRVDFEKIPNVIVRPDMTAHVSFVLEDRKDVIAISNKSLIREDGFNYVIKKTDKGWMKQLVSIGMIVAGKIEILSGLNEGEYYLSDKNAWIEQYGEDR